MAIPILPGGVSTLAGVVILDRFGALSGIILVFVSVLFWDFILLDGLASPALETFFSPKALANYEHWTNSDSKFA